MTVEVIEVLAGVALLIFAADQLVLGAARVAARVRVAPIVVGVVVIGVGTSTPEFLVSGLAAGQGEGGVAMGNLVGSNILNLSLILGVIGLIRPISVASTVLRREMPLMLAGMSLFAVAAVVGLDLVTGVLLAAATIAVLGVLVRLARTSSDAVLPPEVTEFVDGTSGGYRLVPELVRTVVGLAGVLAGAQLLVTGGAAVAAGLGVPSVVIGFTLVAFGTSLPELVTGVQAQRRGETDLLVGNLLGSNLFNSVAGGAIVGLASGRRSITAGWPLLAAMLLIGAIAWALLVRGRRLSRAGSALLVIAYTATLLLLP